MLHGEFYGLTHVEDESLFNRIPVAEWHVATKDIRRNHPRKVVGSLALPNWGA
jgi:hypothetical protein